MIFEVVVRNRSQYSRNQSGATAIEYALIVGSVALSLVTAVKFRGVKVTSHYGDVAGAFDINLPGTPSDDAPGEQRIKRSAAL